MHVRDLNSEQDWKARLSELESIPDEMPLDKDASWDKLHDRIQNKKRSRKLAWYYAAAAAVIAISLLAFFNDRTQETVVLKDKDSKPATVNTESPVIIYSDSPKTEMTSKATRNTSTKHSVSRPMQSSIPEINDSATQIAIVPDTSRSLSDTSMLAIVPPAKKKPKVVHVNEIGPSTDNDPDMAIKRQHRLLPFFNNPGTSTPVANSGNNSGGLKIKFNSVN